MMKRTLGLALAWTMLAAALPRHADAGGVDTISVMTRNEYLGADLTPVVLAGTPAEFFAAAAAALGQIAANDFPLRAKRLAVEIAINKPDVIGLQEVFNFTVNGQNPGPPFVDMLSATLSALAANGADYVVAAHVVNLDIALPLDVTGDSIPELIGVQDRDVILVRKGISFTTLPGAFTSGGLCGLPIPNPVPVPPFPATFSSTPSGDGCNFTVVAGVASPVGPITIERGFVGIDAQVGGKTYRIVNTHLEVMEPAPGDPTSAIIQTLQSVELVATLQTLTPPDRRILLIGDINSSPLDVPFGPIVPPYQVISSAGYADAWNTNVLAFLDPSGYTCCQQSDLANKTSLLDERIDVVFVRGGPVSSLAFVTGRVPIFPLNQPPNWSSDHGGVMGRLYFPH